MPMRRTLPKERKYCKAQPPYLGTVGSADSCNALRHCLGAAGSGSSVLQCHTAPGAVGGGTRAMDFLTAYAHRAMKPLSCAVTLPKGTGQCNCCNALPQCLGARGSATPAMHCHTA